MGMLVVIVSAYGLMISGVWRSEYELISRCNT